MSVQEEVELLLEMKRIHTLYINLSTPPKMCFPENPVIKQTKHLLHVVKVRLSHLCNHQIVKDVIEVGEITKNVMYCCICETTF